MLDSLLSLLAFFVIGLTTYGLGSPVVRGLRLQGDDPVADTVWSLGIGLIVGGLLLTFLGMIGGLYVPLIAVLTSAGCLWGMMEALRACARHCEDPIPTQPATPEEFALAACPWAPPPRWLRRGIVGLAAAASLGSLMAALAPPTAGDALCYHLELPKNWLIDHRLAYLPDHDNSTFPLLAEMWYLWGLALDGPVAAQLIHWGLGILLGLATGVLATPVIGRAWGCVAGALVLLIPGVNNQMTAPLNDLALAAMATLAVAAWWQGAINGESRRWFVLAGLAAGAAISTKYLALVFAAAVAVVSTWLLLRHSQTRRQLLQGLAVTAVVATSIGGMWYVRAAWYRGNPVFPFLTEVFVARDPEAPPITLPDHKAPLGRHPLGLPAAAWQVSMHPERVGGRSHQIGVVFLAVLPGLALTRRLRGLFPLLAVAGVYWVFWYVSRQNVRFLLPVVPLLSVGVAWVWIEMARLPALPRRLAGGLLVVLLVGYAALPWVRSGDQWAVACGLESRDAFLQRREPTWPAAAVASRLFGPDAHLLTQDARAYYFPCRVTRENAYRRRTRYDRQVVRPGDFVRVLRQAGFTHLLLVENLSLHGIQFDGTLSRLADAEGAAGRPNALVQLTEYRFQDTDGALRRYRLVMLGDGCGSTNDRGRILESR